MGVADLSYACSDGSPTFVVSATNTCTPNSPDLNAVDYSIWILLQEKVYHSRIITDVDELKTRLGGLIDEWAQSIVDGIVLSRHIVVYFFVLYFCVFSAYVANKRLHICRRV